MEIEKEFAAVNNRYHHLLVKIEAAARAVLPVLKDSGRTESAKRLEELFFEMDAVEQERQDLVMRDPLAILRIMARHIQEGQ